MAEAKIFWTAAVIWFAITIILSLLTQNEAIWLGGLIIVSLVSIWRLSKQIGSNNPWKAFYMSALLASFLFLIMMTIVSFLYGEYETLMVLGIIVGTYLIGGLIGYAVARKS